MSDTYGCLTNQSFPTELPWHQTITAALERRQTLPQRRGLACQLDNNIQELENFLLDISLVVYWYLYLYTYVTFILRMVYISSAHFHKNNGLPVGTWPNTRTVWDTCARNTSCHTYCMPALYSNTVPFSWCSARFCLPHRGFFRSDAHFWGSGSGVWAGSLSQTSSQYSPIRSPIR